MSETTTLIPIFGSNRQNAERPGELLRGCAHVTVLFAGGMSEIPHIEARQILVNDKHRHAINLATCVANRVQGPKLYREWRRWIFHDERLEKSQAYCQANEPGIPDDPEAGDYLAAFHYFIAVWLGPSAKAGTDGEFKTKLSIRYGAGGGGSAVRFQSAIRATVAFRRAFRRCEFSTLDVFELLGKIHDTPKNGIYADPPSWPGAKGDYKHKFQPRHHAQLAQAFCRFQHARIVLRYGDHPSIRELYPEGPWEYIELDGRTQANNAKAEILLVRKRNAC